MLEINEIVIRLNSSKKTLRCISLESGVPHTTLWRLANKKNKTEPKYSTIKTLSDYFEGL